MPYQPFVEVLEHIVRNGPASEVRAAVVNSGTLLTRILPDIALRFPDLPEPVRAEPGTERYLLFEAVNSMLSGLAEAAGRCSSCSTTSTGPIARRSPS